MVRLGFLLFICFIGINVTSQKSLVLSWEIQHPITLQWFPLGERGSVQEALCQQGILPDPFYGENEKLYQWIEEHQWNVRSRFFLSEEMFNATEVELDFPCIDTYASIFINKKNVLEAENYFHPYHIEIRDQLVLGYNEIEAVFTPPVLYHKTTYENQSFHYPAPNDNAKIKAAPLTRKPQYQFGWDWAPRLNTLGFPNPVSVRVKENHAVKSVVVNTIELGKTAHMQLIVLKEEIPGGGSIRSSLFGFTALFDSSSVQRISFDISNPILWWPTGSGPAYLYIDTLILSDSNGVELQRYSYSFGVRTVKLLQEKDEWGTSFSFEVNGKPMFMKGGDMIPPSMYGGKTSTKEWGDWVKLMVNGNFNMVRIWGGGDYATEDFLNECDRLGLMVWHDAMFACAMYPGDSMFLNNVTEELEYQLPRITAHPSVVYFNGNNEVDVAWKNWGFQAQYLLSKSDQSTIEKAYDDLFKNLLPNTLSKYSNVPYVHTSPLSNWGKSDFYNHGTQHYWGVWHGTDPMSDFATKIGRFNAEFGFQSFPEFATLNRFSVEKDWNLNSSVMKHHQKSYVGNGMILKHAERLFGKPTSFKEFVYLSQLTQAYAVSSAIGGHLLDAPRCMGSLFWQLNDCWPGPTWSSIDFYGNHKALHYEVSDLFSNITALKQVVSDTEKVFLLANNTEIHGEEIGTSVYNIEKEGVRLIKSERQMISLDNFKHALLFQQKSNASPHVVTVELPNKEMRLFLLGKLSSKRKVRYETQVIQIDFRNHKGILLLENTDFMADVWFYSTLPGVHFTSNFCHFLPGRHEIPFTFDTNLGEINLMYR
jgi:beta-mannosidase